MIQQNTPAWEEMRKSKVGASDAPVIMGVSPYTTPYQLWEQKLGLKTNECNYAMKRGHDLEPKALAAFEEATGYLVQPEVKFHKTHHWMMASLDAVDLSGKVIAEIKCPGKEDHEMALAGRMPHKYFPQLQHQMEVCELEMAYYFSFDGQKGVAIKVYRDDKYIKNIVEQEKIFYECVVNLEPPQMTDRDYYEVICPKREVLTSELKKIRETLIGLEKQEKEIEQALIMTSANQNSIGGGIKITKCLRKGNVDYSRIPQLQDVDLESYRKKHSEYWRLTFV
jgi:putative phage-type endonuclease